MAKRSKLNKFYQNIISESSTNNIQEEIKHQMFLQNSDAITGDKSITGGKTVISGFV